MRAEQLVFGKVWGGHVTLAQDAPGYYWYFFKDSVPVLCEWSPNISSEIIPSL